MRQLPGESGDGWDECGPAEWEALASHIDDVHELLVRHVAWPSAAAADAVAAWIVHAHLVRLGTFDSTPRLAFLSPEKGSGKTRALEVLALLVPNPLHTVNTSAAAMFRVVEKQCPTLLMDEADSYLGPKVSADHEDVRGLVNAGHRRGATALRCVGDGGKMDVKEFSAFCAVALAGIGFLPDTIMQRSVIVAMKRRRADEIIQPFRARVVEPIGFAIRDRIAAWCDEHAKRVDLMEVSLPVADRAGDVWEALVTIGDAAGDEWSRRVRNACTALSEAGVEREASLGVRLLSDVRRVFDGDDHDGNTSVDKLHTERLLERLNAMDDAPWGDLRGRELDARRLAKMLHPYDVRPTAQRIGDKVAKGYDRDSFYDAWQRYLARPETVTSETAGTPVALVPDVTHPQGEEAEAPWYAVDSTPDAVEAIA